MQINVSSLSKKIGNKLILSDISFRHLHGVLGIAGPNGSGKSTLLKCLSGLMKPSSGSVSWSLNGEEKAPGELKHQLGYAAPYISHYSELTTRENLLFVSRLRNLDNPEKHVDQMMQEMKIDHRAEIRYGSLSSGQQQRVRLASALLHNPRALFLDEPGTNLDEAGRELIEHILNRARSRETLVLLASNQSAELEFCDSTVTLSAKA